MAQRNKLHTKKQELAKDKKSHASPRKLARSVAHNQFKILGFDNVDKPFIYRGHLAPSYFASHWRKQVFNNHIQWDKSKNKAVVVANVK
jgi:hypothetical protein